MPGDSGKIPIALPAARSRDHPLRRFRAIPAHGTGVALAFERLRTLGQTHRGGVARFKSRTTGASRMSTAWVARHGLTSAQYQAEFDKLIGQGYRLVEVSGYA